MDRSAARDETVMNSYDQLLEDSSAARTRLTSEIVREVSSRARGCERVTPEGSEVVNWRPIVFIDKL